MIPTPVRWEFEASDQHHCNTAALKKQSVHHEYLTVAYDSVPVSSPDRSPTKA